ncbi:hypothetical protein [Haloplanus pelagicus]|nr:hypothetical protein [Haloplanus sp. HW8-1]
MLASSAQSIFRLQRIRDCWLELDSLVDETAYDDVLAPTELQIKR